MTRPKRILIVDDEEANREILGSFLEALGYVHESAQDGFEAIAKLNLDIDMVITDLMMPGMDGFELTRRVREQPEHHDLPIIMLTSLTSKENNLKAIEAGVNDFVSKPIEITELRVRTRSLLMMKEAQDALKRHKEELEKEVGERTESLRKSLEDMASAQRNTHQAHIDTIHRLAIAAEYKDEHTASHIHRISTYCALLARTLNLTPKEMENLRYASPMHDVGKIGTPDAILLKPGRLNREEWEIMKQHTVIGGRILNGSSSELLRAGEVIALTHHEKWDGTGYPEGLAGEAIPLEGRICAVADVFDALTTVRPYKNAFPNEEAISIMKKGRGNHFDPAILDLFFKNLDELLSIRKKFQE